MGKQGWIISTHEVEQELLEKEKQTKEKKERKIKRKDDLEKKDRKRKSNKKRKSLQEVKKQGREHKQFCIKIAKK